MAPYPERDFIERSEREQRGVPREAIMKRGKPHIYRSKSGHWTCEGYRVQRAFFLDKLRFIRGHGVTPSAAFRAWRSFFESDR